jgi:hypothetical protein
MKCIKSIRQTKETSLGETKRVDDKTAHNMVGNLWQYISKTEWKKSIGKVIVDQVTGQSTSESTDQKEKKVNRKIKKNEK